MRALQLRNQPSGLCGIFDERFGDYRRAEHFLHHPRLNVRRGGHHREDLALGEGPRHRQAPGAALRGRGAGHVVVQPVGGREPVRASLRVGL